MTRKAKAVKLPDWIEKAVAVIRSRWRAGESLHALVGDYTFREVEIALRRELPRRRRSRK